jgi:hypothetical protein
MPGKPAEPPPTGALDAGKDANPSVEEPSGESIGPLAIERLRKDDGRALILYSLIPPDE